MSRQSKSRLQRVKKNQTKPVSIPICPYCGAKAVLRPASYIHGDKTFDTERNIYVCSNYERGCDAYVYAQRDTNQPLGFLADKKLRRERQMAHEAIIRVVKRGIMDQESCYNYLETVFGFPHGQFHFADSSGYYCREGIRLLDQICENRTRR